MASLGPLTRVRTVESAWGAVPVLPLVRF